jgi:microcystin synthetase protein McyG
MPAPSLLEKELASDIAAMANAYQMNTYYGQVEPKIRYLCAQYILRALAEHNVELKKGDNFTTEDICQKVGVVPEHMKYADRLLNILAQNAILKKHDQDWSVMTVPGMEDTDALWSGCLKEHPAYLAELILLSRVGREVGNILCDKTDPLTLIFPQGSSVIEAFYRDAPILRMYNQIVRRIVCKIAGQLPRGETLRVLEIGAGTGSVTSHVVDALPLHHTAYLFSDISQSFINQAQKQFSDYPFMAYKTFDIEKDFREQGFRRMPII